MKGIFTFALGLAAVASTFAATIDLSTGVASWQVFIPGTGTVAATSLTGGQVNTAWAPAPTGSTWVSWGPNEGVSCVVGQTPGNGCAHTVFNPSGSDVWTYSLTISALSLGGATSGNINLIFGSDNRVSMFVGLNAGIQIWDGGSQTNGNGFNPLACAGQNGPTSAGASQGTYSGCTGTIAFSATNLNGDGSLTFSAYSFNDPIPSVNPGELCPPCGDPAGFVVRGSLTTGSSGAATPEPATFGLVALAGIAGYALRRKRVV